MKNPKISKFFWFFGLFFFKPITIDLVHFYDIKTAENLETTVLTVNRSSIRKICLNKDELLRGLLRQNIFYHFLRKTPIS